MWPKTKAYVKELREPREWFQDRIQHDEERGDYLILQRSYPQALDDWSQIGVLFLAWYVFLIQNYDFRGFIDWANYEIAQTLIPIFDKKLM